MNYQPIIDAVASCMAIGFPIFLILEICSRFINIFLDFVAGKEVRL